VRDGRDVEQRDSPAAFRGCTELVESLRKIEAEEDDGSDDHPSEKDLYAWYESDIERHSGEPTLHAKKIKKH
jgi:hypothetical protein